MSISSPAADPRAFITEHLMPPPDYDPRTERVFLTYGFDPSFPNRSTHIYSSDDWRFWVEARYNAETNDFSLQLFEKEGPKRESRRVPLDTWELDETLEELYQIHRQWEREKFNTRSNHPLYLG